MHTHILYTINILLHPANCKQSNNKCAYFIPSVPSKAIEWKHYIQCTHSTLHSGCLEPELAAPPEGGWCLCWAKYCLYWQPASSLQQGFLKGQRCKSQASCHLCCWHLESKQGKREVWAQLCSMLLLWMTQLNAISVCVCVYVRAWEHALLTKSGSALQEILIRFIRCHVAHLSASVHYFF